MKPQIFLFIIALLCVLIGLFVFAGFYNASPDQTPYTKAITIDQGS